MTEREGGKTTERPIGDTPSHHIMARRPGAALLLLLIAAAATYLPSRALGVAQPKTEQWRDHTLTQSGPSCIAEFYRIVADNYPSGDPCAVLVQQSFAAVNKEACPGDMGAVQRCLGKTSSSADAFTELISRCPLLNVRARKPGETATTDAFSCFGVFDDPEVFRRYANGTGEAPKGSHAAKNGAGGLRALGEGGGVGMVAAMAVAAVAGAAALL